MTKEKRHQGARILHAIWARSGFGGIDFAASTGPKLLVCLEKMEWDKTTLLKILAWALANYDGAVTVAGKSLGFEPKGQVPFLLDESFMPGGAVVAERVSLYADSYADLDAEKANDFIGFFRSEQSMQLKQIAKRMRENA